MKLYLNFRFIYFFLFSRFLRSMKNSPYFIFRLQLSVSNYNRNWKHTMSLQNVTFPKKQKKTKLVHSLLSKGFWHNCDLRNVYVYSSFDEYRYQWTSKTTLSKSRMRVRITLSYCLVYIDTTFIVFEIGQELHSKYHIDLINRV